MASAQSGAHTSRRHNEISFHGAVALVSFFAVRRSSAYDPAMHHSTAKLDSFFAALESCGRRWFAFKRAMREILNQLMVPRRYPESFLSSRKPSDLVKTDAAHSHMRPPSVREQEPSC
jgi:hypothetical protein